VSGVISDEPPRPVAQYPTLLPQVDADGNDIDGLRSLTLRVPLGTYTGWNVRRTGFSQGDSCDLTGAFIPFAVSPLTRAPADPRRSLVERYTTLAGYQTAVTTAAAALVAEGLLLPTDQAAAIASVVKQASQVGLK
jgi:hypothetical protein